MLTFVSGNQSKAASIARYLGTEIAHHKLELDEIQSLCVETVALRKAEDAYAVLQRPLFVEDFSVSLDGLNGLPGAYLKDFTSCLAAKDICGLIDGKTRQATAKLVFALKESAVVTPRVFVGQCRGVIATAPRGDPQYVMQSIFIPQGSRHAWGEMSREESDQFSIRRIACDALRVHLEENAVRL